MTRRLHPHLGGHAGDQAGRRHPGHGAHIVHGRAVGRLGLAVRPGRWPSRRAGRPVAGQAGSSRSSASRPRPRIRSRIAAVAGACRVASRPTMVTVQPAANTIAAASGSAAMLNSAAGRDVAAGRGPAHDHEVPDLSDDLRVVPHRERDIGQRPDRDQRDLPGRGADRAGQEVNGVPVGGPRRRRRQADRAEAGVPVHLPGVDDGPEQRPWAARHHRYRVQAHVVAYAQRVRRGQVEADVAGHRGDPAQLKAG